MISWPFDSNYRVINMDILALKRIVKSKLDISSSRITRKKRVHISVLPISISILFMVIVFFCVVHLGTVSILGPCGKELKKLNQEKEALVENNRKLEQEIAQYKSHSVVTSRAEKELNMKCAEELFYLDTPSVSAEIHSLFEESR
ncbi:MAG: septum formation initiator family protein [Patescibacteria group bacterium]|nr:septum formation initiator family protein [Patescibacteria group bacterium]